MRVSETRNRLLRSPLRLRRRSYTCNICGEHSYRPLGGLEREVPSCESCGAPPRLRSVVHALSLGLFGGSVPISQFPDRRDLRGVGLSDWEGYAARLPAKLDYTNTFLHMEPRLDIVAPDPDLFGTLDFLIASEVFEHVDRPVERAFENAHRLLKSGGLLVLTVPYGFGAATVEHFPELREYSVVDRDGGNVLVGTALDGRAVEYRNLVFHGGDGVTLEMRQFALDPLLGHLSAAGFDDARVLGDEPRYGVVWPEPWSRPILATA
jgi:SAM-dependent methyltransferase